MHDNDTLNQAARLTVRAVSLTDPEARRRLFERAAELRAAAEGLDAARESENPN